MDPSTVILPVVVAIHLVATETLAGMLLFLHAVIGPAAEAAPDDGPGGRSRTEAWCRAVAGWCVAAAVLTLVLWLGLTAASVSGAASTFDFQPTLLRQLLWNTQFGLVWLLRFGVALMLAMLLARPATRRPLADDTLPWAGMLLLALAMSGHAGAAEGHHAVLLTLMGLHLAATAVWLGSLPPLLRLLAEAEAGGPAEADLARQVVHRYVPYGGGAVALLVASGVALAWLLGGGGWGMFGSDFGRVLLAKLALFAAMGGLGLVNRFWASRRLATAPAGSPVFGAMWRVTLLEFAVGSFVVLAAAILGQTAPPGH